MVIKKLENVCMTIASSSVCLTSMNDQLGFLSRATMRKKDFQFQTVHPVLKLKVKNVCEKFGTNKILQSHSVTLLIGLSSKMINMVPDVGCVCR